MGGFTEKKIIYLKNSLKFDEFNLLFRDVKGFIVINEKIQQSCKKEYKTNSELDKTNNPFKLDSPFSVITISGFIFALVFLSFD